MLKISVSQTALEEKWIVCGRLTAPWIREFRASWKKLHRNEPGRPCVVDLNQITLIDKSGERWLRTLLKQGARFIASGVYTRHVLDQLNANRKRNHSRFFGFLFGAIALALSAILIGPATVNAQSMQVGGSVSSGPATSQVIHLTLRHAIDMALRYNLAAIETGEDAQIARGQRLLALSALLPQVAASGSENVAQVDLAAEGIKNIPGVPAVVGPFGYSSVDASLSQTIFSFESIQRFRAARSAGQAARLSYQDTLDAVTLAVGNAYLQAIEASSQITAQEAQVKSAQALYRQAVDEYQAGTRPRIDVVRTEVQLHSEQYTLSVDRNNFAVAKLTLARAIGLPLGQQFELADQLPYANINPPTVGEALDLAYQSRSDYHSALDSVKAAQRNLSATNGQRYPVALAGGDYGDIGTTFAHSHGDFTFQAGVTIPLFTGGRIKADIVQARAQLRQRQAEAENVRRQVDYDVRTAFLNLNAAKEQVGVAQQNVGLANENLTRSRDRFSSGVTDSVEVVQAEQSLASADDQYITAVYDHNLAKLTLARALGVARTNYSQYVGGQ
jgi:outer membrane protein TolC